MKITLEINTSEVLDIKYAIDALNKILPNEAKYDENIIYVAKEESIIKAIDKGLDFDMLEGVEIPDINNEAMVFKKEIDALKADLDLLKSEKLNLLKENETLTEKVSNLEIELSAKPEEPELVPTVIEVDNIDVSVYEDKIASLTKDVAFHEGRSNKNFEEVKRLRTTVDNMSSEKRDTDKRIIALEKEIESLKEVSSVDVNSEELTKLVEENKVLKEKLDALESVKERLQKEVDFQKNRSKANWDEIKSLKVIVDNLNSEKSALEQEIEELSVNSDNINNKEDVEKLKSDLIQVKSEYENTISELRLSNDKLQNEINLCKAKYSEEDLQELAHLKKVKQVICGNDKGASFWNNVESNISNI